MKSAKNKAISELFNALSNANNGPIIRIAAPVAPTTNTPATAKGDMLTARNGLHLACSGRAGCTDFVRASGKKDKHKKIATSEYDQY